MAIVDGPALSLRASGNLGAICYAPWRSLKIARDVWTGTVPNTAKQVTQQGYLTTVSQAWGGTLTADERETWNGRAKTVIWSDRLGNPYIPNGYQLFMKWNIRRLVMGLAILTTAPGAQDWETVEYLYTTYNVGGAYAQAKLLDWGAGYPSSYGLEYYRAGPYDSGGRNPIEGEWRFKKRTVPPNRYNDTTVVALKWYWYRARQIAQYGDVGNWFEGQVYTG